MKAKLEAYGVKADVEGSVEECGRILSVWFLVALSAIRAQHGDVAAAETQLNAAIARVMAEGGKVH